jgi:hypothetical protein
VAICLVKGKLVKNLALVAATLFFGLSLQEGLFGTVSLEWWSAWLWPGTGQVGPCLEDCRP